MSEKEFLLTFIDYAEGMGKLHDGNLLDSFVDEFLTYHHQTYFEVEFIKKDLEEIKKIYDKGNK